MAKLGINTGSAPDAGNGDSLLIGAIKINSNFNELYNVLGNGTNLNNSIGYALTSGISTVSQGLTGTPNITVGTVGASFVNVTGSGTSTTQLRVIGISTLSSTNISGDLTFTGNNDIYLKDSGVANFGNSNDLQIYHNGSASVIRDAGTGGLQIDSDSEITLAKSTGENMLVATVDGSVSLYHDNSKKFETLGTGVTVTGTTFTNQLNVSGISTFNNQVNVFSNVNTTGVITATTFSGNATTASYATLSGVSTYSSLSGIASYTSLSGVSTYSSLSGIATYALNAGISTYSSLSGIASYSNLSGISSYSPLSGVSTYSDLSGISTYSDLSGISTYSNLSGISSYSSLSGVSTYSDLSGISTYSSLSGVSTNVIGGIGSLSQLLVSGVSTITNGPVFIGTDTSTGTSGQLIQIDSGAYVSGSVGVGTTNPTSKLTVIGGDISVGISTNHGVILTSPNGTEYRIIVDDSGNLSTVVAV